jgi:hypothetical protein
MEGKPMSDEDHVERILLRILYAIKPDQGDGFVHIFNALEQAMSFQMALLCPDCRRKLAQPHPYDDDPRESAGARGAARTWRASFALRRCSAG